VPFRESGRGQEVKTMGTRYIKGEHFHLSKRGAIRSPLVRASECLRDCPASRLPRAATRLTTRMIRTIDRNRFFRARRRKLTWELKLALNAKEPQHTRP